MILLVEDTPAVALVLARMLRDAAHEVVVAATVREAMDVLATSTPTACVLDLVLDVDPAPLHAALTARRIPVLLVSGTSASQLPDVATAHGWRFLAKPFEAGPLLDAVSQLVVRATGQHPTVLSSIVVGADGSTRAVRSTAAVVGETLVDLAVVAMLASEILVVRPASPVVVVACIVGVLLVSGVRAADLVALSKGPLAPPPPGPLALLFMLSGGLGAGLGALLHARLGGS